MLQTPRRNRKTFRIVALTASLLLLLVPPSLSQRRDGEGDGRGDRPERGGRRGGGGIRINLSELFGGGGGQPERREDPLRAFWKDGPQLPDEYPYGSFIVRGVVKGDWPLVLDFKMDRPGTAWLEVTADDIEPFYYRLDGRNLQRQEVVLRLPGRFGEKARPALYAVRTLGEGLGEVVPLPVRVFGLGVGPKAVGSMKIDEVSFGPESIHLRQKQEASYRFHSRDDFDRVTADIMPCNGSRPRRVRTESIKGGLRRDAWVGRDQPRKWDGKISSRTSTGLHELRVRAWTDPSREGDFAVAISADTVEVLE